TPLRAFARTPGAEDDRGDFARADDETRRAHTGPHAEGLGRLGRRLDSLGRRLERFEYREDLGPHLDDRAHEVDHREGPRSEHDEAYQRGEDQYYIHDHRPPAKDGRSDHEENDQQG